ncbi:PAS domain S-box protein [Terasakiella sp. A23]|uniref:PAS domain S-box protein n=1 Tax=Terasakiella sp. FCG-A23 TaxID=3080561 RepID=UPI002953E4F6|nr:PAS domain S-box protein [Terasakiella sp. A23]MDV7339390.1 PAS domain S-box protein [Terasakiella sp. A23]
MKSLQNIYKYTLLTTSLLLSPTIARAETAAIDGFNAGPGVLLGTLAGGLILGALIHKRLKSPEEEQTPLSRKYLAAFERISQGFNLFLRTPEKTTEQQAIEWLLRETSKTLDVSRTCLWFFGEERTSLSLKYAFDATDQNAPCDMTIDRQQHPAFFGALRGERTVAFDDAQNDVRSMDFLATQNMGPKPKSVLVAVVGIGRQSIGTLHIAARKNQRNWTNTDRQFAGSIADLIAFYLSNRDLQIAQSALHESESRFRDLVDASSDWYWQTGPDHKFTYISDRFTTTTGIPKKYLLGRTRHDFTKPKNLPSHQFKHWEDLQNRRAFRNYKYSADWNSMNLTVAINGKAIFDNDGNFAGYIGTGTDISESVTYKTRFEEGLNALSNGLVMWDANDKLIMWNNAALDMFPALKPYVANSFTYREMLNICDKEKVLKFPAPFSQELCDQLVEAHKSCGIREIELYNGHHLLVHEHPTSEGGIVGIYTDITTLKSRENELIESNKISTTLSLSGNTLIHARNESFILSEICRLVMDFGSFQSTWVNLFKIPGSLPEFLDISMQKGLDMDLQPFKPTSTIKQTFVKQNHMIMNEHILHQAFPNLKKAFVEHNIKSGGIFPIRIDTKLAGFLCVVSDDKNIFNDPHIKLMEELASDIGYGVSSLRSEHHRLIAEEALRESEGRYRSLVDMSPDAILVLDENDRIVFSNPEGHALFATKNRTEFLGKRFANYVCDDGDLFKDAPKMHDDDPTYTYTSVSLRRMDDETFEADITTRPVSYIGLETRLLIIRDVTERNRVNEHLAQTSKLATLGEMAAGITHELSQPLNIMRFAAEGSMLKMNRGTITTEQIQKQFDLISMQSARMADIIDHMRIFSRKDTGSLELFDPALVIRQAVDMIEAQYLAENIHMDVRYPPYYQTLKGRPIQLEQVILNLITNAHDAINQRRKNEQFNSKEINRIDVNMTYDQADNMINIAVTDNGGGISEKAMAKLFDPFFTTKEVGKGTGLGLSVSYGIIAAMGGQIQARNIHKGARFDITLPCVDEEDTSIIANIPDDIGDDDDDDLDFDGNGLSVLVVDDEVYAAEAMMEYLFTNGYEVNMAGDGEEALELYEAEPCDIVVTDIRMPKMDGHHLIKHLKERKPDLPIIVVTGHTGIEETDAVDLNEVAFCVLKKPVSLSNLASQVEKAGKTITKET